MKHRLERVNELLKRELSEVIVRDITFHNALVTVHAVDVTPDLKHAHVYVSVIGDEGAQSKAMRKLADCRGDLQQTVAKRVVLKYTPYFHFKLDTSVVRGTRVMQILDEIAHDLPPEPEKHEDPDGEWDDEDEIHEK